MFSCIPEKGSTYSYTRVVSSQLQRALLQALVAIVRQDSAQSLRIEWL